MTKIYKTKTYLVTYKHTGGMDVFSGRWILSHQWLLDMIDKKLAFISSK